ncbi:hypothetical protein B0H16DRAFT_1692573 [Mycena metata]|uniref:Uncharacterized protein n=1 Tax=Mycena metata TaxID=1033252 RepID=A0AAD7IPU4_9AGAR|nr:hypothetical protein B0H16DRAFT_1692573 [Mycena metata]
MTPVLTATGLVVDLAADLQAARDELAADDARCNALLQKLDAAWERIFAKNLQPRDPTLPSTREDFEVVFEARYQNKQRLASCNQSHRRRGAGKKNKNRKVKGVSGNQ